MITIYGIKDINDEVVYIGSTKNYKKRYADHKNDCYNPNTSVYTNYKYVKMRENGGFCNYKMFKMCEVIDELRLITEEFYIRAFKPKLNKRMPNRNNLAYKQEFKEELKKKDAEKILCEICNCRVRRAGMAEHKRSIKHINNL